LTVAVRTLSFIADVPFFSDPTEPYTSSAVIGPGVEVMSNPAFVFDDDLNTFLQNNAAIYLYSKCTYKDVFNQSEIRSSEVCIRIVVHGMACDAEGNTFLNFSHNPVGQQNTAI